MARFDDQQLTVDEFLTVREYVAAALKQDSSTQLPTRIRQAENLMRDGIINIPAVLAKFPTSEPQDAPVDSGYPEGGTRVDDMPYPAEEPEKL